MQKANLIRVALSSAVNIGRDVAAVSCIGIKVAYKVVID